MLSLTDPIWRELQGGYRTPYDASKPLAQMERGESVWDELWNELHHQGDIGVASYAAIPQLVRIAEAQRKLDWNLYALRQQLRLSAIGGTIHRCPTGLLAPTKKLGALS
jgi:hypothetical protein